MKPLLAVFPGHERLVDSVSAGLGADVAEVGIHTFPDGESKVTVPDVAGRSVAILCSLDHPDPKWIPLVAAARTMRELGATRVGLIAPYLCYMRQDRRFQPGEAVTAPIIGDLLSNEVDWLVTIDPHLHRIHDLAEIYAVPARSVTAAPALAAWIAETVERPLLVGPDEESGQWIEAVASYISAPTLVLRKVRTGDRQVAIEVPDVSEFAGCTPVLVDDIVSTGRTMAVTAKALVDAGLAGPVCVGVHGLFVGDAREQLLAAGATAVVTTNAVAHPSNGIDIGPLLAEAAADLTRG